MHGTLLNVNIEGIEFKCPADIDVDIAMPEWDNDVDAYGSGPGEISSTKMQPGASNIVVHQDPTSLGWLKEWVDSGSFVEFFMTLRDGSVYGAQVLLKLESTSSAKGIATLSCKCRTKWDVSAA